MGNLDLWERVRTPDAAHLKPFDNGKFKGTAIRPAFLARSATEQFGPVGIGWGFDVVDERYVEAGPVLLHVVRVRLWYLLDGKRGEVVQYGQTVLVSKNGHVDDEAPKKSLTDAVGKCLSLLGFAADVHMGLWDGDKYTAEAPRHKPRTDEPKKKQSTAELMRRFIDRADKCDSDDDLNTLLQRSSDDRAGLKLEHNQMLAEYAAHRSMQIRGIVPDDPVILDAVAKLNALRGKK